MNWAIVIVRVSPNETHEIFIPPGPRLGEEAARRHRMKYRKLG